MQNTLRSFSEAVQKLPNENRGVFEQVKYEIALIRIKGRVMSFLEDASSRNQTGNGYAHLIACAKEYRKVYPGTEICSLNLRMLQVCKKCFEDIQQIYSKQTALVGCAYFGVGEALQIMHEEEIVAIEKRLDFLKRSTLQREQTFSKVTRAAVKHTL